MHILMVWQLERELRNERRCGAVLCALVFGLLALLVLGTGCKGPTKWDVKDDGFAALDLWIPEGIEDPNAILDIYIETLFDLQGVDGNCASVQTIQRACGIDKPTGAIAGKTRECLRAHAEALARARRAAGTKI